MYVTNIIEQIQNLEECLLPLFILRNMKDFCVKLHIENYY